MILNASPRAPKSNSKRYAQLFSAHSKTPVDYFNLSKTNHKELSSNMGKYSDVVLVFPLYADAIPVTLLNFLKVLEENPPEKKPTLSVIINCGFLEYQQNEIATQMIALFCNQNQYSQGSILKIGSGEAILDSPFRFLVERKIKKFSNSISQKLYHNFQVTMPLPKKLFVRASTQYWTNYGKKYGTTKEQMQTMQIEK